MKKIDHAFTALFVNVNGRRGGKGHAEIPLSHVCLPTCPCDRCGRPKSEHPEK